MKTIKRMLAVFLIVVMGIQLVGCGKSHNKDIDEGDIYNAVTEKEFEYNTDNYIVSDGCLYGSYYKYSEELKSENDETEVGIFKYNFETKETLNYLLEEKNMYIDTISINKDKNIEIIALSYSNENIDKEEISEEITSTYIETKIVVDNELKKISEDTSDKIQEKDNESYSQKIYLKSGKYISYGYNDDGESFVDVIGEDGIKTGTIDTDLDINEVFQVSDEKILAEVYDEKGNSLYELDLDKMKMGDKIADLKNMYINNIYVGNNNTLLFIADGYAYRLNCETGKKEKILKFIDCDINQDMVKYMFELEDGTLGIIMYSDEEYNTSEIDFLVKQEKDAAKRTEITLGTFVVDDSLKQKIIKYNKSNDKYRIVVKEYFGSDEDDYQNAINKFNADIVSGDCPDIIDFSTTDGNLEKYAEKGVLQDLSSYFENDSEINLDDFVQSVVNTYKIDNKIYALPTTFSIQALIGPTDVIGKDIGWTMDEFIDMAKNLPEGMDIMADLTSDILLYTMVYYNMSNYVNWSTGECKFNTGEFAKLLEFCSNYKSSEELYKDYDKDEMEENEVSKIRNNKLLMRQLYMDDISEYMVSKVIYNKEISVKGYPIENGNGVVVNSSSPILAISTKSKNKDEAWNFIRQLYLKDDQSSNYGFSIRQDELDDMLKKSMEKETYIDDNGVEQIVESTWGWDDIELTVPYPTENDITEFKKIIDSIDSKGNMDDMITTIINEETQAFFQGQKTANEVAEIVQSRVSIYVKENK